MLVIIGTVLMCSKQALFDRICQLQPQFIFAETSYSYNGKVNSISSRIKLVVERLRSNDGIELVLVNGSITECKW